MIYAGYNRLMRCKNACPTLICGLSCSTYFRVRKNDPMTRKACTPPPTDWQPAGYAMKDKNPKEEDESQTIYGCEISGRHFYYQPFFITSTIFSLSSLLTHQPQGICTKLAYHSSMPGRSRLDSLKMLCVSLR